MDSIAVIGAGVAGLSAARRLALVGHRPILVAPERDVPSRGETLSAKAAALVDGLGWSALIDGDTALASAGRFSIWGDGVLRRATEREHGAHIDRSLLERRMAASLAAADGIERLAATAVSLEHLPGGARVGLSDGRCLDAAAIIDGTGRAALSCGPVADRRRLDRLVAAYRVLDVPGDADIAAATLVEAVDLGWWYMAPMPGRRMMLGLFTDSDLLPAGMARDGQVWADHAGKTLAVAARLESLDLESAAGAMMPMIAPAASVLSTRLVEGRILRSGDSAAALDPLGANGLATALWSGIQAADAALALVAGDAAAARGYESAFLEGIAHHLATQRTLYAAECRFTAAPFWGRRHASPIDEG